MVGEAGEANAPEFRNWSLENFGQVLKASADHQPNILPYRVQVPKNSAFFRNVYKGIYKGEGVTVYGSKKGRHSISQGIMVEHHAVLAVNDIGELMVSKEVFQGNHKKSLTEYSKKKLSDYYRSMNNIPLPLGWRRIGDLHSHPLLDIGNTIVLSFANNPKSEGIGVTWSGGDFNSLVGPIREGNKQDMVMGVITPVQLGFMVASKKTIEVLQNNGKEVGELTKTKYDLPPYNNFEKLGVVLYAGKHLGSGNNFVLHRLIY